MAEAVFSNAEYDATADLLIRMSEYDPENPWAKTVLPDDLEAIHTALRVSLERAVTAVTAGEAYDCFQIPKSKRSRLSAPRSHREDVQKLRYPLRARLFGKPGKKRPKNEKPKMRTIESPDAEAAFYQLSDRGQSDWIDAFRDANMPDYSLGEGAWTWDTNYGPIRMAFLASTRDSSESSYADELNVVRASQRAVAAILSPRLPLDSAACAFRKGMSPYEWLRNLLKPFHLAGIDRIESAYQLDLRNFFPSVSEESVSDALFKKLSIAAPFYGSPTEETIRVASRVIARVASIDGRLPQWGHLSPLLSNHVASVSIDAEIGRFLRSLRDDPSFEWAVFSYGRYADDLVIFASVPIPPEIRAKIDAIVSKHFTIAEEKRSYLEGAKAYEVWGASVLPNRAYEHWKTYDGTIIADNDEMRHPERVKDFAIRLPKRIERRIVAMSLDFQRKASESCSELSDENSPLRRELSVLLGYYSHAFNVCRSGNTITQVGDVYYGLSKPLVFAWKKLRRFLVNNGVWEFRSTFMVRVEEEFERKNAAVRAVAEKTREFQEAIEIVRENAPEVPVEKTVPTITRDEMDEFVRDMGRPMPPTDDVMKYWIPEGADYYTVTAILDSLRLNGELPDWALDYFIPKNPQEKPRGPDFSDLGLGNIPF